MSFIYRVPSRRDVRRAYDFWSRFYDVVAAPWESGARMRALDAIHVGPGQRILDVGVGPGASFAEILSRADGHALVCGLDLSHGMVRRAQQRAQRAGLRRAALVEADALTIPFASESFDAIVSSYVLDLMSVDDIVHALTQLHRVLKPGGRIILVNLTKVDPDRLTWYERCYEALPPIAKAYVLGGCRPVCLTDVTKSAGFVEPQRTVVRQFLSSEIVIAEKPGREAHSRRAA